MGRSLPLLMDFCTSAMPTEPKHNDRQIFVLTTAHRRVYLDFRRRSNILYPRRLSLLLANIHIRKAIVRRRRWFAILAHFNNDGCSTKKAPPIFQRALHLILNRHKWETCLLLIYYIIICCRDIEEHLHHGDETLTKLGEAGITRNLKKLRFFS